MEIIDIVIIAILAIGFVRGLKNGFARELGGVLGIILGVYLAMNFAGKTIDLLDIKSKYAYEIGFVVTLVGVIIAVALLARILTKFLEMLGLDGVNKIFGGVLSVITYILVMSILLEILESFNSKSQLLGVSFYEDSFMCKFMIELSDTLFPFIGKYIKISGDIVNDIISCV